MENFLVDDFQFWQWINREPKLMNMFSELERSFKKFESLLTLLGYNYTSLEVFPFDQRRVTIVFGEYEGQKSSEKEELNKKEERMKQFFSINFDNIMPEPQDQPEQLSYEVYAMWWANHKIPEKNDFVNIEGVVQNGVYDYMKCNKLKGKSQEEHLKTLIEFYNNLIKIVNTKKNFDFPMIPQQI
ncbi:hypothetical protein DFR86_00105 [Acidianus sulfidivorans JP7]|uniref:Uncharacterized protein n=1 Tax=Acidianus sulfidivorans JP7 TaxID=619593 RepID=A0A2U9IJ94_9CREN|nr:hypothetical protein [Acidianus sulfidivorans]AWR96107.1 hypothetical protein DFR86_00105 [Acidianus sulfidivorans JP7]